MRDPYKSKVNDILAENPPTPNGITGTITLNLSIRNASVVMNALNAYINGRPPVNDPHATAKLQNDLEPQERGIISTVLVNMKKAMDARAPRQENPINQMVGQASDIPDDEFTAKMKALIGDA